MLRFLLTSFISFALLGCETGTTETVSSNTETKANTKYKEIRFADVKATASEKLECEAVGGIVRPAGRLGADHCIQELPDAGKTCSNASECLGRCVLEGPDTHRNKRGTKMIGVCERTNDIFGCTTLIENGEVEGTLCID